MTYNYFDFTRDLAFFLKFISFNVDVLMKNEYYILFMIIAMIFMLQIGVPLILEYFVGNDNNDN